MYCESVGSATSQARLCAARSASRQLLALLQCRALAVTVTSCIQSNSSRSFAHPFREGNGRTQREFFAQLLAESGHGLTWDRVDMDALHMACHLARTDGDTTQLRTIVALVLTDEPVY